MATAPLRPLPDFLVIGAKRGGTTSLYRALEAHRNVLPLVPSSRILPLRENSKGVHYFDTGYHHGPTWYRSHFATGVARRLVVRGTGASAVTGEASPYYLFHPNAAERAASLVPGAKIVVLLRDPVERARSHFSEQRRNGVEALTFEEALEAEPLRLAGEVERMQRDPSYVSFAHEHQSYLAQSAYSDSLSRWLGRFPDDQVCVVCSEELYARPEEQVGRVLAFLGLGPGPGVASGGRPPGLGVHNAAPRPPVPEALRRRLEAHFEADVALLEQLTGRSFPWPADRALDRRP
ncbi:MAG: sulfotransferase [Actinomycetota bacterium]|nr:sulfotransferase [Actinomycetota bacterium]